MDLQFFFRARSNESFEYINISKIMKSSVYMDRKSGFGGGHRQNTCKKNFQWFPIIVRVLFGLFEVFYACMQKDKRLRGNREISPLRREV